MIARLREKIQSARERYEQSKAVCAQVRQEVHDAEERLSRIEKQCERLAGWHDAKMDELTEMEAAEKALVPPPAVPPAVPPAAVVPPKSA